jgi:hypothetical protein
MEVLRLALTKLKAIVAYIAKNTAKMISRISKSEHQVVDMIYAKAHKVLGKGFAPKVLD